MPQFRMIISVKLANGTTRKEKITVTADDHAEAKKTRLHMEKKANCDKTAYLDCNVHQDFQYRMMHGENKGDAPGYD